MSSFPIITRTGICTVTAVHGVDSSGEGVPSAVTYDVQILVIGAEPGETSVVEMTNAKPNQLRPPDLVKLVAARVGHTGFACRMGATWFFNVIEQAKIAECSGGGTGPPA